ASSKRSLRAGQRDQKEVRERDERAHHEGDRPGDQQPQAEVRLGESDHVSRHPTCTWIATIPSSVTWTPRGQSGRIAISGCPARRCSPIRSRSESRLSVGFNKLPQSWHCIMALFSSVTIATSVD